MKNYAMYSKVHDLSNSYKKHLERAEKEIKVLSNESGLFLGNLNYLIEPIKYLLFDNEVKLSVIFGCGGSLERDIHKIKRQGEEFFKTLRNLNENPFNNIYFHWISIKPKRLYTIIDNVTTIVEGDRDIINKLEVFSCFVNNIEVAQQWKKKFEEMWKRSEKVNLFN